MKKIIIRKHYTVDDPQCERDYDSVDVILDDGDTESLLTQYGDHYHDKGAVKAEAFVEGFVYGDWPDEDIPIMHEQVADLL